MCYAKEKSEMRRNVAVPVSNFSLEIEGSKINVNLKIVSLTISIT